MKTLRLKKFSVAVLSCLFVLAVSFGAVLGINTLTSNVANAETLSSTEYKTDGASVRVFKKTKEGKMEETDRKGIRFHVEMGEGYAYNGTTLLDTADAKKNSNGAYKMADGFKSYTLIIPSRLLDGELSMSTPKVMAIDTTGYWFSDSDDNWESVAYVHSIPDAYRTETFTFKGIICTVDGEGNVTGTVAQTLVSERCFVEISKLAYADTIADGYYWGSQEKDDQAAAIIKGFIPTLTINYGEGSEEVFWGEASQSVPEGAWYNNTDSEEFNKAETFNESINKTISITSTKSNNFILTGVAALSDYSVNGNSYNGAKVYATLPTTGEAALAYNTQLDIKAVDVTYEGSGSFGGLQGVWTIEDGGQMRLFFAFDDSTLANGGKLHISGDSIFYANGIMYKLTEDYTIDITKVGNEISYGIFLGYLYGSDIQSIYNAAEDSDEDSVIDEYTIRIDYISDILINGEYTFVNDNLPEGYAYPAYIQCGEDENYQIPVTGGSYYWNNGEHKIMELIGEGEYENKVYGWHEGDILYGAPGTMLVQNGGYYIFEDEMYAYFNGTAWLNGNDLGDITNDMFYQSGEAYKYDDTGRDEVRFLTNEHLFNNTPILVIENTTDAPMSAYYTSARTGESTEITEIIYHGHDNGSGDYYQLMGFRDVVADLPGDTITIAAGTRFWVSSDYWDVTEDLRFCYNGKFWFSDYDGNNVTASLADVGGLSNASTEIRLWFDGTSKQVLNWANTYCEMVIDPRYPVIFNGEEVLVGKSHSQENDMVSILNKTGTKDGDYFIVPAGSTWWTEYNGSLTFTEEILCTFVNGAWTKGDYRATLSTTADNATISGLGGIAKGSSYTFTVTPNDGYVVQSVTINGNAVALTANNQYTFTAAAENTIAVVAIEGYRATFTVGVGAVVNGGAITNGTIVAVSDTYTFTLSMQAGYKLVSVTNATDNGDGSYTISSLTANTTVTINTERLYQINVTGSNVTIKANGTAISSGAYVENGATITISANSGYTLLGATGATNNGDGTFTVTVNGADLNVAASALATNSLVNINNRLGIEDRAWGAAEDEFYFGILDYGVTNTVGDGTNNWLNTATRINDCWYVGNNSVINANNGVDIMQYIYVNNRSARELIAENESSGSPMVGTTGWLTNPAASPVYVETTEGSGIIIKILKEYAGDAATLTFKAGFSVIAANGDVLILTEDITFEQHTVTVNNTGVQIDGAWTGQTVLTNAQLSIVATALEGYKDPTFTVEGAVDNGDGTWTVKGDVTITASATKKTYTVTVNTTNATVSGVTNGQTVEHGQVLTLSVSAADGYENPAIEVTGATKNGDGTYTVTGAVTITATAKKTYTVTATVDGGVSVDATSKTVGEGGSVTFTLTPISGATLKANGETFDGTTYTVSNVTANTTVAFTSWFTVTVKETNATVSGVTNGQSVKYGDVLTISATASDTTKYNAPTLTVEGATDNSDGTYTVTGDVTVTASADKKDNGGDCLAAGTMITLENGKKQAVELLNKGDKVMAFDHTTGEIVFNEIIIVVRIECFYHKNTFVFDDGTELVTINEHGIFDLNLNKYVNIDRYNYGEYLGHDFVSIDVNGNIGTKKLIDVVSVYESGYKYDIVTDQTLNYVAEDTLSVTHVLVDVINTFEFGENLVYDQEKMQEDIQTYGLYTYEEWEEYCDISVFEEYNIPVMKVGISKGLYTQEYIIGLINKYVLDENVQII